MTLDGRLQKLEAAAAPQGPVVIRVVRIPPDVPPDERDGYSRAHPECVSRTIEVIP